MMRGSRQFSIKVEPNQAASFLPVPAALRTFRLDDTQRLTGLTAPGSCKMSPKAYKLTAIQILQ